MIEIVGHFGTLYSYATVGGRVTEALHAAGMLARVSNLDTDWHPGWEHLRGAGVRTSTHCIVFTAPHQYIRTYAAIYGKRSAVYVSPNTTLLDEEHAATIADFGWSIAPSRYCSNVVAQALGDRGSTPVVAPTVLPIGSPVRSTLTERRVRRDRLRSRLSIRGPVVLHLTSDQAWPGRKGTEELLDAWLILHKAGRRPGARLVIHGPPSIQKQVLYRARDYGIDESVEYRVSALKGEADEQLVGLYDQADLVVQPSRCEGFGMMILGAIDAGVPLLTTYNTGHAEFLSGVHGGFMAVATPSTAPIAYEVGEAPVVEPELLAYCMDVALLPGVRRGMLDAYADRDKGVGAVDSWRPALDQWIDRIRDWIKEDT